MFYKNNLSYVTFITFFRFNNFDCRFDLQLCAHQFIKKNKFFNKMPNVFVNYVIFTLTFGR